MKKASEVINKILEEELDVVAEGKRNIVAKRIVEELNLESFVVEIPELSTLVGKEKADEIMAFVRERKKVAIIGRLGTGKSTILKAIAKELKIDGNVTCENMGISDDLERVATNKQYEEAVNLLNSKEYVLATAYSHNLKEINYKLSTFSRERVNFNGALHCIRKSDGSRIFGLE